MLLFERLRLLMLWQNVHSDTLYVPLYLLAGYVKGGADKRERKHMQTAHANRMQNHLQNHVIPVKRDTEFYSRGKLPPQNNRDQLSDALSDLIVVYVTPKY